MKNQLLKIVSMADGVRTDMSMLIINDIIYSNWREQLDSWGYKRPANEFWVEAIGAAKSVNSNVIFLAEVYWSKEADLMRMGFDFVYEKTLLDTLATYNLDNAKSNIR